MKKMSKRSNTRKRTFKANACRRESVRSRRRCRRRSVRPASRKRCNRRKTPRISGLKAALVRSLLFAEPMVTPRSDGSFVIAPGKPIAQTLEVGTFRAARMLGISHTALRAARESELGRHYLRWRFTSENQRVLAWEVPSLMAYKEATRLIGK